MNKLILFSVFMLIIIAPSLHAQNVQNSGHEAFDSTEVMIQALLNPSVQTNMNRTVQLKVDNLFEYANNNVLHYLHVFNSEMAKFLLARVSENVKLDDYYSFKPSLYENNTAFQYNFIKSRTRFNYVSNLHKAFW